MKVLCIYLNNDGGQMRLMYHRDIPDVATANIDDQGRAVMTDDYDQTATFWANEVSFLTQDTEMLDALEVEMMCRNHTNQMRAQQQVQNDPRNMIVRPGGLVS
jgi:hypothetical protein